MCRSSAIFWRTWFRDFELGRFGRDDLGKDSALPGRNSSIHSAQPPWNTLDRYETGGVDVTLSPYRLTDCQGRAHSRPSALGVPVESVHWVNAAGARPGANSFTFQVPMRWREPRLWKLWNHKWRLSHNDQLLNYSLATRGFKGLRLITNGLDWVDAWVEMSSASVGRGVGEAAMRDDNALADYG